ncbi:DUF4395 domain-containing protein [Mangrovibacillus cuniculi]|uniref:DUF4395 domain-containing protein n=1 Tax=Mangrovibacillus cuniculi TaxID=2593652 RepID=A0A7S8C8U6_9BACI|nr:DUF4395 domain-containing protein [Mangrovibacillus cuniculi]QPC45509.1 DUF4395 domain-containing protein [Mangrovibacillus cuniculi]
MPTSIPKPLVLTNQWFIVASVLVAWIANQPATLFIPLVVGLISLFFKKNVVIELAKPFLKKPFNEYPQEDVAQQQFNQWIAVICQAVALVGAYSGITAVYFIFSGMVATAAFVAILGFCVGCFIRFQWQQYRYRRSQKSA